MDPPQGMAELFGQDSDTSGGTRLRKGRKHHRKRMREQKEQERAKGRPESEKKK